MARLLIYDAYENKVYTYANLNENDPMPYSTGTTLRQSHPVDHQWRLGSLEPDPAQIRQRHPGGVCLPPDLGRGPRYPEPALRRGIL